MRNLFARSFIFAALLAGCASLGNNPFDPDEYYIKQENAFYQPRAGEFYDLKDKINKQEYRRLPYYLQICYEKEN